MPLEAGYTDNFTMKSGTTISANELTALAGENYTYTVPAGETGPATDQATLNGTPVASFNGNALQFSDAAFDRDKIFRLQHFVIRGHDGGADPNYVEDSGSNINTSSFEHHSGNWRIRIGSNLYSIAGKTDNEWVIITILREEDDANIDKVSAWINDTKVQDGAETEAAGGKSGNGSTLGIRGDLGFGAGIFDLAQYAVYFSDTMPVTEQEILANIAFLNSEWGIYQPEIPLNPIFLEGDGSPKEGVIVKFTAYDDHDKTGRVDLETVLTDVNGVATLTEAVPAGKLLHWSAFWPEQDPQADPPIDWVSEGFFTDTF